MNTSHRASFSGPIASRRSVARRFAVRAGGSPCPDHGRHLAKVDAGSKVSIGVSLQTIQALSRLRAGVRHHDKARSANARAGSRHVVETWAWQAGFIIDIDKIDGQGCVIIKREGLLVSPPEHMEVPYAAKDEIESVQESMCESTVSSLRPASSRMHSCSRFMGVLDRIQKAHET
jgi:hypothetical protein